MLEKLIEYEAQRKALNEQIQEDEELAEGKMYLRKKRELQYLYTNSDCWLCKTEEFSTEENLKHRLLGCKHGNVRREEARDMIVNEATRRTMQIRIEELPLNNEIEWNENQLISIFLGAIPRNLIVTLGNRNKTHGDFEKWIAEKMASLLYKLNR